MIILNIIVELAVFFIAAWFFQRIMVSHTFTITPFIKFVIGFYLITTTFTFLMTVYFTATYGWADYTALELFESLFFVAIFVIPLALRKLNWFFISLCYVLLTQVANLGKRLYLGATEEVSIVILLKAIIVACALADATRKRPELPEK